MDFYTIPPLNNLNLMHLGDRYFCLAQLYIQNEEYRHFFQDRVKEGSWVTLDNGAGDHNTVSREQLLDIARELQPSELIPLDILFDRVSTLDNLDWTIDQMNKDPKLSSIEILACPQGSDFLDWNQCYQKMLNNPKVNTIGMSKLAIPYALTGQKGGDVNIGKCRNSVYYFLLEKGEVTKPLHFLGAGEAEEFAAYVGDDLCRSTDSCFIIWSAMNNQRFGEKDYKRIPTPKAYFDLQVQDKDLGAISHNLEFLKNILK